MAKGMTINQEERDFVKSLKQIVQSARGMAYAAINYANVRANWLIGQRIVEQMQKGENRAEYGTYLIKLASEALTEEFGKGFSETNIKSFRKFYLIFSNLEISSMVLNDSKQIGQTLSAQSQKQIQQTPTAEFNDSASQTSSDPFRQALPARLSWTHFERLMRVEDEKARNWYLREASEQMWSVRTLDRNINTMYYERIILSQVKEPVEQEMKEKTQAFQQDKLEFIKNPTVLEFLGLPGNKGYKEKDLEKAILDNLSEFLMELGKGFAFVGRQQLIRTEAEDYYIDLVFYNYLLKAFVLVDLKVGKVTHQDVGQMDMYIRMFDELKRGEGDNPTIGILLCSQTDKDIARYSILKGNEQLFATKYKLILPSEEQLAEEIGRQKEIFLAQQ
jgi:predicted nuclease of restriction endonuclease-like (RecB) superfamily